MRFAIFLALAVLACGCPDQNIGAYNTPPEALITSPAPDTVFDTATVEFVGSVQDNQTSPQDLLVTWFTNRDPDSPLNTDPPDSTGECRFTATGLVPGEHVITLQVVDEDGASDEETVSIVVAGNPPEVTISAPQASLTYYDAEDVVFQGTVRDPDGLPFAATAFAVWESNLMTAPIWEAAVDTNGITGFSAPLSAGNHVITLTGTSPDGAVGSASVSIVVGSVPPGLLDQDGDGWCPDGEDLDGNGQCEGDEIYGQPGSQDCDDNESSVHPGAEEICDGIPDNNCDGDIDETDRDADLDGYSPCQGDCDDTQPLMNPGAAEVCDGLDNNCDGALMPGGESDEDLDLYFNCDGDCDDTEILINPAATEICDGVDNDCDGVIDEGFDADGDGFVNGDNADCADHFPEDELDCDDANTAVNPDAIEICNDWDDDCDGYFNENADPSETLADEPTADGLAEVLPGFSHVFHAPPFASCPAATCPVLGGIFTICRNSETATGSFASAQDQVDLFVIEYDQLATTLGCAMNIGLAGIPSGHDYSLELFRVNSLMDPISDWELVNASDNGGNSAEAVTQDAFDLFDFSDDTFVIAVRNKGYWSCPTAGAYTLTVTGG